MNDTLRERVAAAMFAWDRSKMGALPEFFTDPEWCSTGEQEDWLAQADAALAVLHEAGEQGDGMCPDPECATDHICGDGGCRMNTLLADMGHERWVDAWREAADWRDQYRADREDGVELLKDILAWNFEAIPPGFASRIEGYISRVERQSSPAVAGEHEA